MVKTFNEYFNGLKSKEKRIQKLRELAMDIDNNISGTMSLSDNELRAWNSNSSEKYKDDLTYDKLNSLLNLLYDRPGYPYSDQAFNNHLQNKLSAYLLQIMFRQMGETAYMYLSKSSIEDIVSNLFSQFNSEAANEGSAH